MNTTTTLAHGFILAPFINSVQYGIPPMRGGPENWIGSCGASGGCSPRLMESQRAVRYFSPSGSTKPRMTSGEAEIQDCPVLESNISHVGVLSTCVKRKGFELSIRAPTMMPPLKPTTKPKTIRPYNNLSLLMLFLP